MSAFISYDNQLFRPRKIPPSTTLVGPPWDPKYRAYYDKTEFGIYGDRQCRPIVIDGANVAHTYGKDPQVKLQVKRSHFRISVCLHRQSIQSLFQNNNQEVFSIIGIKIAVEHFWELGCRDIIVILPAWRQTKRGQVIIPEEERELQQQMHDLGFIQVRFD